MSVELVKSHPPPVAITNHRVERIASHNGDSGIEDNTESESGTIHNQPIIGITSPTTNQNLPQQQNGIRRRGSIWNIFGKKSNKKDQHLKNLTLDVKGTKQQHKTPINRSKSLPVSPPNSNVHISPQHFHHKDNSSRTSDLGDSIPSTPVSTISSGTGFPEIPGILGLHNLGNTCYFNTILQCLAHIEIISEYFIKEHFMKDLAASNNTFGQQIHPKSKLQASVKGGKLAETFSTNNISYNEKGQLTYMIGLLIKSVWDTDIYSMNLQQEVMNVVQFYNSSLNVYEQQDALEFFMWLVDQIHQEIATGSPPKRKSVKAKELKVSRFVLF